MQMIKWNKENAHLRPDLQASEQYFTSSQFFAHFLRHSKGSSQRAQIFGAKPFLVRAIIGIKPQ
jgi:hypothetical protein